MTTPLEQARKLVLRLPDTIRVGPFDLAIEKWSGPRYASGQRKGHFSPCEQAIAVAVDHATPIDAVDTLLHEIGHAVWWAYGVHDEDKEERIVATLATAWLQVYRDNRWLLDWLRLALA